jgi:hypothetical protein
MQFFHPPVTASLQDPNNFLSTLFSNTHNLCSCVDTRDKVPHTFKLRRKILVIWIYLFIYTVFKNCESNVSRHLSAATLTTRTVSIAGNRRQWKSLLEDVLFKYTEYLRKCYLFKEEQVAQLVA